MLAASIPYLGIKNIFKVTLIISPNKVIYITALNKPMPFKITPVRLLSPIAITAKDNIFKTVIDSEKRSV